ncbi:outer membrane beta-barrel protein [Zunongwangia sp. HRR-M8]|uniref:outer membrane beta-barrel protein n=1 Tax=Zunongwangia sp. HRR-M8 TaxID=3015170 RepID=UPI0022DD2674|nr:outer membrane beta-barrel protein [Zunongwangia sp. HRR-M8]WBL22139.1 outer membrane beta-barrel protein [Zunongwangia sp. HRR-M8]
MKNILALLLLLFFTSVGAQESKFGLTAGFNYSLQSHNGDLVGSPDLHFAPDAAFGGQGGIFYERTFGKFLIRPQALFYRSRGEYSFPNSSPIFTLDKLNFELLLGYEIFRNIDLVVGPGYQNIVRNDFNVRGEDLRDNMSNLNIISGLKIQLNKRLELSLMYDWTFDSDENQTAVLPYNGSNEVFLLDDARVNILTLNVSYAIFTNQNKSRANKRAKSGGRGCYF